MRNLIECTITLAAFLFMAHACLQFEARQVPPQRYHLHDLPHCVKHGRGIECETEWVIKQMFVEIYE